MIMPNNMDQTSALNLVRRAQTGDAEAFGSLYDAYIRKIYDFVFYKTLTKDSAEDITSTVFLKAWKNIAQFKEGSFSAWLYMIARNAVTDHYRKEREALNIEDCWDLADGLDLLGQVDDRLSLGRIKDAMSKLKVEERELIIMRIWLDLPFREIAEQLGKKEGAVKVAFGRLVAKLKNNLSLAAILLAPGIISIWKNLK